MGEKEKMKTTREQAKKELGSKIVEILLLKPIYTKPGTSKDTSKDIETIHKRDELLALFEHLLEKELGDIMLVAKVGSYDCEECNDTFRYVKKKLYPQEQ